MKRETMFKMATLAQLVTTALPLSFGTSYALTTTRTTRHSKVSFSRRWESNTNGHLDDHDFLFGDRAKQRNWWFEDQDNDDDDEFSFFQVFRAFGWMLPAIGVSLLLGTGPNAFLMALIPLGQTALSLTFDKLWGTAGSGSKPRRRTKTKTKRKPFGRPANGFRNDAKPEDFGVDDYSSWEVAGGSAKMGNQRAPKFGGWDELDRRAWASKAKSRKMADMQKGLQKNGRLRKRRDSPLFVRLLIAVFPFLGSWTRFFF